MTESTLRDLIYLAECLLEKLGDDYSTLKSYGDIEPCIDNVNFQRSVCSTIRKARKELK